MTEDTMNNKKPGIEDLLSRTRQATRQATRQQTMDQGWLVDEVTGALLGPNNPQVFAEAADFMDSFGDLADKMIGYAACPNDVDEVMATFGKVLSELMRDGISDEAYSLISSGLAAANVGWRNQAERYRDLG